MRKVVKHSRRFAGKWKDFTPWKTSQVDFIDEHNFVKYCCARKLTRVSSIAGMNKNNNKNNNKDYLQNKQQEKTEFLKNICPHIKDKDDFIETREEKMEKRSIIIKLPQQGDDTPNENKPVDVKVHRKKVFKQKSTFPRSKSGEVMQSSTFKSVADKLNRSNSLEKEAGTWGNYASKEKVKECIEKKVQEIEKESSRHVKELADLISPKNKHSSKVFVQSNHIELPVENRTFSQKVTKPDKIEKFRYRQTTKVTKPNHKEAKNDPQNPLLPSLQQNSILSRLPRLSEGSEDWEEILPTFKLAVNRANLQHKQDTKRMKIIKNKSMSQIVNFAQSRSVARLCKAERNFHVGESPVFRRWDGAEGSLYPGQNKQVVGSFPQMGRSFYGQRDNRPSKLLFLK